MKYTGIRSSVLVYFLLISFTEFISKSTQKRLNWFEAQKVCMDNNTTLKSGDFRISTKVYWSGIYLRYSSRIHILGCYSADNSTLSVSKTFDMKFPSVGFCQEICGTENIPKFGIHAGKCTCFENLVSTNMLNPSECNEICAENKQGVKFTECGGRNAYSVYMAGIGII
ncbi:sialate:O-sulfotransferase 1-like [Saccostrea cucullata]|uniref:sialate:O-sulfotransferase 1-like n=1 Tax=Saccostrea cuccullata TaxID=36930 RepID=UPI002ED45284